MFCPECGKKIEEGALFCPECGTKITKQAQPQPADSAPPQEASAPAASPNPEQAAEPTQTPASTAANASATEQPAAEPSQAAPTQNEAAQPKYEGETAGAKAGKVIDDTMSKFKSLDKTKKYGIVGGGIAAVVLVAIIAFVMPLFGGVPTDVARQAFAQSSLATNGAVSSNYTNASAYEIKDFRIDKQEDALAGYDSDTRQMAKAWYGSDQLKTVYFSGTIANESFETNFTGECGFKNINGTWSQASDYSMTIDSKETKPLKGVDTLSQKSSSSNVSYSDFNSDFNESNGTYTSNATSTVTYTYWFATDTAKASQSFTFDPSSGWKASGDATTTDQNTEWTLRDKTFKYSGTEGIVSSANIDASITFGEASDGSMSATYSTNYTPSAGMNNVGITYNSASVKGTATGKATHKFGDNSFSITLNDSGQSVDITCKYSSWTGSSDSKNAIIVTEDTKTVCANAKYGGPRYIDFSNYTFTEATQTNA